MRLLELHTVSRRTGRRRYYAGRRRISKGAFDLLGIMSSPGLGGGGAGCLHTVTRRGATRHYKTLRLKTYDAL